MTVEVASRGLPLELRAPAGIVVLDIEAVKVAANSKWPQKRRFKTIMVGLAVAEEVIQFGGDDEEDLITTVRHVLEAVGGVVMYEATHGFDEMVLKGRFVARRRKHAPRPGPWPNLDEAWVSWENVRTRVAGLSREVDRTGDRTGLECMELWEEGDRYPVWRHNLLDVLDLTNRIRRT